MVTGASSMPKKYIKAHETITSIAISPNQPKAPTTRSVATLSLDSIAAQHIIAAPMVKQVRNAPSNNCNHNASNAKLLTFATSQPKKPITPTKTNFSSQGRVQSDFKKFFILIIF